MRSSGSGPRSSRRANAVEVDTGHEASEEVFFCAEGHVLVFDGERYYELGKRDALLIPPGLAHTIINIGETPATVVWSGAPGE